MKKNFALALVTALVLGMLPGCGGIPGADAGAEISASAEASISFVDDEGNQIALDMPRKRIISLYSAHTENLYSLGVGDCVIGAHSTSIYPPDAAFKPRFDYDADPEKVIAAEPDCVLIRPFVTNKAPDFVQALKNAGIPVVSLYPESLEAFDGYIEKLAMLTGTEDTAKEKLAEFHKNLDEISTDTADISEKQRIFFESTEVELRTATPDSMAGLAIKMAGGENVAADAKPISPGSSIAPFGAERILEQADSIDVYVSQRGAMNAGGDFHSISIRPGFDTLKAVRDGRVYVINEKLISSPTFRYYKGVRELARYLYPERMDDLTSFETDSPATKRDLAKILVKARHLPVYVPSSSKYYETADESTHIYGMFADVSWQEADFDAIETAVISGAVGWEAEGEKQVFAPETPVTRDMLAKAIFISGDFSAADAEVADIADCANANIVKTLVANGIFKLTDGNFEPNRQVTCQEIVDAFAAMP